MTVYYEALVSLYCQYMYKSNFIIVSEPCCVVFLAFLQAKYQKYSNQTIFPNLF